MSKPVSNWRKKFTYIYNKNYLFLLYIYVSSKKGELKIEFDTHDTRDTHDTPPEKVECFFIFFFRHVKRKKTLEEVEFTCLFDT